MPVAKRLGHLGRIGLDEERVRMRQRHRKIVQLALDPVDHTKRLAKIHLCVTGRVRQRDEHFL